MFQLHSFDVFDTVLTRSMDRPEYVFWTVGQRLREEGLVSAEAAAWMKQRVAAEVAARQRAAPLEITLEEIRVVLGEQAGEEVAARAIALELEEEMRCVSPITKTILEIEDLLASGATVVYISDMYLPGTFIESLLEKVGAPLLPIFVSSQLSKTKRDGTIFDLVEKKFRVSPSQCKHVGDNSHSDVGVPRKRGWSVRHFTDAALNPFEHRLRRRFEETDEFGAAVLAGSMRAARLATPRGLNEAGACLWTLSANIASCLHIGFICWLRTRAQEDAVDRLYFIARDGWLPYNVYQILSSRDKRAPAEPHYLYGSRQAWHLPSLQDELSESDFAWMLSVSPSLTLDDWLRRFSIERHEIPASLLEELGLSGSAPLSHLGLIKVEELLKQLAWSAEFQPLLRRKAGIQRSLAKRYFEQQGMLGEGQIGIVDIGWNGRLQRSFHTLLITAGVIPPKCTGYYVGLAQRPKGNIGALHAYLFDHRAPTGFNIGGYSELFETLFSAPHETTLGYAATENGEVREMLAPSKTGGQSGFEARTIHEAVKKVSQLVSLYSDLKSFSASLSAPFLLAELERLFRNPHRDEALAFSELRFSQDQLDIHARGVIQAVPLPLALRPGGLRQRHPGTWIEGSIALSRYAFMQPIHWQLYNLKRFVKRLLGRESGPNPSVMSTVSASPGQAGSPKP